MTRNIPNPIRYFFKRRMDFLPSIISHAAVPPPPSGARDGAEEDDCVKIKRESPDHVSKRLYLVRILLNREGVSQQETGRPQMMNSSIVVDYFLQAL